MNTNLKKITNNNHNDEIKYNLQVNINNYKPIEIMSSLNTNRQYSCRHLLTDSSSSSSSVIPLPSLHSQQSSSLLNSNQQINNKITLIKQPSSEKISLKLKQNSFQNLNRQNSIPVTERSTERNNDLILYQPKKKISIVRRYPKQIIPIG